MEATDIGSSLHIIVIYPQGRSRGMRLAGQYESFGYFAIGQDLVFDHFGLSFRYPGDSAAAHPTLAGIGGIYIFF